MEEKNISEKVRKSVVKEFLSKTRKYREDSVLDGEYNFDLDKHIYRSLGGKVEIHIGRGDKEITFILKVVKEVVKSSSFLGFKSSKNSYESVDCTFNIGDIINESYSVEGVDSDYFEDVKSFSSNYESILNKRQEERDNRNKERQLNLEKSNLETKNILSEKIKETKSIFDEDGNGIVDIYESEDVFSRMLRKYQSTIIDINESHISSFVKLSTFLKNKREGIQSLFISLDNVKNEVKLEIRSEILQSSIQSYRVVLFHSINMITSIVKKDLITFHEIYESLDNLRIFDSKFERDMTRNMGKLNSGISEINTNLEKVNQNLMNLNNQMNSLEKSINNMESNIISELSSLSYVTQNSIEELGNIVQNELSEIDSTLKWNNMLTGIQTYQMYKINKNTKNLRG